MNHGNELVHPAHDDDQQQLQQQQCSYTLHSSRQVYTRTYSYIVQHRTALKLQSIRSRYSVVKMHTVSTYQKVKKNVITHTVTAAPGARCMFIELASRSPRRHVTYIFLHRRANTKISQQKTTITTTPRKRLEPQTPRAKGQHPTCSP